MTVYGSATRSVGLGLAERLTGVTSSPVRELLALTRRPEVISFAGGLPAPELFDLPGLRAAFGETLSESSGRSNMQTYLAALQCFQLACPGGPRVRR